MNKDQAIKLGTAIRKYWSELGAAVEVEVVSDDNGFGVKTNLVNGLPPNTTGDELVRRREQIARAARSRFARPL